jgi:hypothetical protein
LQKTEKIRAALKKGRSRASQFGRTLTVIASGAKQSRGEGLRRRLWIAASAFGLLAMTILPKSSSL